MKSNVIMKSDDRVLFGITIRQQTDGSLLNLSDLVEAYTVARVQNSLPAKNISRVIKSQKFRAWFESELGIIMSHHDNPAAFLKRLGLHKTTGARHTKTVWINEKIWDYVRVELFDNQKNAIAFKFEEKFSELIYKTLNGIARIEYQKKILKYRVDFYIPKHNLIIEFDENRHDKQPNEDRKRQDEIEWETGAKFIRVKIGFELEGMNAIIKHIMKI